MDWKLISNIISLGLDSNFGIFSLFRCRKVNNIANFLATLNLNNPQDAEMAVCMFIYMLYSKDPDINTLDSIPFWKNWRNNIIMLVPHLFSDSGFNLAGMEASLKKEPRLMQAIFQLPQYIILPNKVYYAKCQKYIDSYIQVINQYYPDIFSNSSRQIESINVIWMKTIMISVCQEGSMYYQPDVDRIVQCETVKDLNSLIKEYNLTIDFDQPYPIETTFIDLASAVHRPDWIIHVCNKLKDTPFKLRRQAPRGIALRSLTQLEFTLRLLKMKPMEQMSIFKTLLKLLSPDRNYNEKKAMLKNLGLDDNLGIFNGVYATNAILTFWSCFCPNYQALWNNILYDINLSERRRFSTKYEGVYFNLIGTPDPQLLENIMPRIRTDYSFIINGDDLDTFTYAYFPINFFIKKHMSLQQMLFLNNRDILNYLLTDRYNWMISIFTRSPGTAILPIDGEKKVKPNKPESEIKEVKEVKPVVVAPESVKTVKPLPKPSSNKDVEPEPIKTVKPEPKPEPKVETKPETKVELKPEPKPETKVELKPITKEMLMEMEPNKTEEIIIAKPIKESRGPKQNIPIPIEVEAPPSYENTVGNNSQ